MANPFPGMDPYLEGSFWQCVHANLATEFVRYLTPRLRPKYAVVTTERVVLLGADAAVGGQPRVPDVGVVTDAPTAGGEWAGDTAPMVANAVEVEATVPQFAVEIRDSQDRRLVTAIEILSHTNKRGEGLGEYRKKRRELLAGEAHLVEIDLLRIGNRFPLDKPLPSVAYFAFVSRAERRPAVGIWPMPLRAPLTPVPVPLDAGDADVLLDLQAVLDRAHDELGYDMSVDYRQPPPGSFSAEDLVWIDERLRAAARRP